MFGSVHSSEKALLKEFGVRDLPKILVIAAGKSQDDAVSFSGDISHKSLTAFFKRYASPSDADDDFVLVLDSVLVFVLFLLIVLQSENCGRVLQACSVH